MARVSLYWSRHGSPAHPPEPLAGAGHADDDRPGRADDRDGLSTWLLLTDPVVAADVAAAGSLMPLVEAIVDSLRSALGDLLAYL